MGWMGLELAAGGGHRFGDVRVVVDAVLGSCIVVVDGGGIEVRRMHLHSLDEIRGAYGVSAGRAGVDIEAADVARALKFAGQSIAAHQKSNGGRR